jgi:hypothetical protein
MQVAAQGYLKHAFSSWSRISLIQSDRSFRVFELEARWWDVTELVLGNMLRSAGSSSPTTRHAGWRNGGQRASVTTRGMGLGGTGAPVQSPMHSMHPKNLAPPSMPVQQSVEVHR